MDYKNTKTDSCFFYIEMKKCHLLALFTCGIESICLGI